ncbi:MULTISPECIES: DUF1266 domain-containing protein [unclassified Streptomyces]|uniref:DUF1266 domain-containing protein n=1 Tax=unclassified Streptomyces TaxID=2593676 RepID=UPI00381BA004
MTRGTGTTETGVPGAGVRLSGWGPPTGTERLLHETAAAGDRDAMLDALARSTLYVLVARLHADTPGYAPLLTAHPDPVTPGRMCVTAHTSGTLPPWHPEWVFETIDLDGLRRRWPDGVRWLVINPGTPYAVTVAAGPGRRRAWQKAHDRSPGPPTGLLVTHGAGPLHGPLAHGLALGAHLAVHNGLVWNELGATYQGYSTDRARLRNPWGVLDRAAYRKTLEALLTTRLVGRTYESVLQVRSTLAVRLGRTPTVPEWSAALTRRRPAPAEAAEAREALRLAVTYEGRLRADGALGADERVDTLAAYDYGRAVNLARWGLSARFCVPHEAEQAIVHAGALSRSAYRSWGDFSAGYALGRVLRFDGEDYGDYYRSNVTAHVLLTESGGSPWRNIPWR